MYQRCFGYDIVCTDLSQHALHGPQLFPLVDASHTLPNGFNALNTVLECSALGTDWASNLDADTRIIKLSSILPPFFS